MDIKVQDFVDKVQDSQFQRHQETKTTTQVNRSSLQKLMSPIIAALSEAVATGHLAQVSLDITGKTQVSYRLETGVINLPFENSNKVFQFLDLESTVPVKIYLITQAENLNASHFHIDEMGPADELMADEAGMTAAIMAKVQETWQYLVDHPELPKSKSASKAKTTAKKTTAKKAATRKTTKKATTARRTKTRQTK
ncbi:hypothetical protein ACNAN0_10375 [Agrilactobacillus fermenti]|uniref:hypothetical protein n=1 Tax=Agrilactobacillus fermenti TaxID=2586909 RepID=UPI001E6196DD|nr:hypothetical protein [Agrilactobacillus fermenti]MCD2256829.1 hypothetical protein [Agrilactobacillus fermenti]